MISSPSFRCRFCGTILPAWFSVQHKPDGAMLLHHLARRHPTEVGRFLEQMPTTDDIARVTMLAFDPVEEVGEMESHQKGPPERNV